MHQGDFMTRKLFLSLFALCVIAVMLIFTACHQSESVTPTAAPSTETAAPAATAAPATTDAPSEATVAETEAPVEETKVADPGISQVIEDNSVYKNELTDYQWVLLKVYQDREEVSPATYYGSVIRQTGAYIEFNGDNTFNCSLGVKGCKGSFSIDAGVVTLHITVLYDGTDEGKAWDEDVTLKWDRAAGIIDFDYFDVTNEFSKRSEG